MSSKINLLGIDFHFGIGCLSALLEGTGLNLIELGSQDDTVLIPKIMYYSRAYAMQRKDLVIDFTLNDIYDLIDDNGGITGDFYISFSESFKNSMSKNVPIDDKKKVKKPE